MHSDRLPRTETVRGICLHGPGEQPGRELPRQWAIVWAREILLCISEFSVTPDRPASWERAASRHSHPTCLACLIDSTSVGNNTDGVLPLAVFPWAMDQDEDLPHRSWRITSIHDNPGSMQTPIPGDPSAWRSG